MAVCLHQFAPAFDCLTVDIEPLVCLYEAPERGVDETCWQTIGQLEERPEHDHVSGALGAYAVGFFEEWAGD